MPGFCATCGFHRNAHGNIALTACSQFIAEAIDCLDDGDPTNPCSGKVEFRMALSGTGRSFARCDHHWGQRLAVQEETNRRYPTLQPADFDPAYAGEQWDED